MAKRIGREAAMRTDPHALFDQWFAEARAAEPNDPESTALATAAADGRPSVRMVLLKGHDPRGFVFYTNSHSRKGGELAANPRAALLFHWKSLRRQVRAEGAVEPVSAGEADAYFASRSRDSQLGAWASDQSRPLISRDAFEARYAQLASSYEGKEVPRPPHWCGYRLVPDRIEFWTDRPHRLHERRLFARAGEGWTEGLLYP
jgi:pyridoxamine 5'-phosphate oxidase